MTPYALLFTLAAIGIAETVYLIQKRVAGQKPICLLGETCEVVLESKYNTFFGIHNDILGLAFYIVLSVMTAFVVIGVGKTVLWDTFVKVMITAGAIMSLRLLYIQGKILKVWCFWCLMSSVTVGLMGTIVILVKIF